MSVWLFSAAHMSAVQPTAINRQCSIHHISNLTDSATPGCISKVPDECWIDLYERNEHYDQSLIFEKLMTYVLCYVMLCYVHFILI